MTEREKIIYDILCSDEQPPEGQHWEGFVTNKIVAALAQPEPWVKTYSGGKPNYTESCERCGEVNPAEIHTCTPKQREWQGLTLDEIYDSTHGFTRIQKDDWVATDTDIAEFAHIIEARLKAKNT